MEDHNCPEDLDERTEEQHELELSDHDPSEDAHLTEERRELR